jgi:23S rRNA pseudouridine1911/1915/1917 synthase
VTDERDVARFVVTAPDRVDRLLVRELGLGRRRAKALVERGCVRVDGHRTRAGARLAAGASVDVRLADEAPLGPRERSSTREVPRILWRRGAVVALFKPVGYHAVRGRGTPSLADFVVSELGIEGTSEKYRSDGGLAHRLDRDTSGIVVAGLDERTYHALRDAFARGAVAKEYLAIVEGRLTSPRTIDVPLTRLRSRVRPARRGEPSRPAVTTVEPLEAGKNWTLVAASMRTGVTHQIRAHLAHVGFPIVGDAKYGGTSGRFGTHRLHAFRIGLAEGESLTAGAGVEFVETLAALRRDAVLDTATT